MGALADIRAMREAYETKIRSEGKTALQQSFKAFFEANPKIDAVRWEQYTPHFNDGDPCSFSLHEFRYKVDGLDQDGGDYDDGFYNTYGKELNGHKKAIRAFEEDVRDDDVYEAVFGDGVRVTATRDGFTIDEYSHY